MGVLGFCFGAAAFLGFSGPAVAGPDGIPDDEVQFMNSSSSTATIFVDGNQVCALGQSENCSTSLWANDPTRDPETLHPVRITIPNGTYDDPAGGISISTCHWNWIGISTYVISDSGVHFDCSK